MKRLLFLLPLLAIAAHAAPVSLFDGKSLDGWDYDPAIWRVEDGMITGGSTTEKIKANYFICTRRSYQNFELRMKIQCSGDPTTGMLNSGIQIRSVRVPGGAHMSGYQVDCGKGWFGKIYDEFRRNKVIAEPLDAAALDKAVDVFGWNEYRIRAEGPRIQVWINGVAACDYTEQDKSIALDGQLGPQVHSGGVCLVKVKDVTIEELPPTPGAPTWESLGGVEAARAKVLPPKKGAAAPTKPMKQGNTVQGAPKSAREQQKLFHLPEGFEIELVVQESDGIGKFVSVYFDQRGRMWTQTAFEYPVDGNENPAAAAALYKSPGKDKVLVYPREALNAALPAGGLTHPTVFTDGLAIPLGILPWGNGDTCYIQHGHDLKLFKDTNGDGKVDTFDIILTGFGVQDSHLFPHQFTRAPGGWIWMAQGLFNNSKVRKPDGEADVDWPKCSMAKMRPDGSGFEVTSTGPNNIWGLVITGEGEAFIQEANDYGYPVMPFHEYAYYPGGMEALKRSYQPDFPPQAEFRMGGTGLSGLALGEGAFRKVASTLVEAKPAASALLGSIIVEATLVMFVANPITSKVQTLAMHRDGPYWKLEQAADLLKCDDPYFRPVALTNGPDGCIYIVDWYNKIISHNEVPRSHPDRDKTRGRIWRVKAKGAKTEVADFTKLSADQLTAALKDGPIGKYHLAWQTLADRKQLPANHWAGSDYAHPHESDRLRQIGRTLNDQNIGELLAFAKPSLPDGSKIQSSHGAKQIPAREAYEREFERFLVRMFLERHQETVAKFLDSEAAKPLPVEARLLASLALEPKTSAARVAKLLPQLQRAPGQEEILRLAQFPEEPGVGEALRAILANPSTRIAVLDALLAVRTRLDAAKLSPILAESAKQLLASRDDAGVQLGVQLAGAFKLVGAEDAIVALLRGSTGLQPVRPAAIRAADPAPDESAAQIAASRTDSKSVLQLAALRALSDIGGNQTDLFAKLAESSPDTLLRDEALAALASSKAGDAPARVLALYPKLASSQRRTALERLSATKPGAGAVLAALNDGKLAASDLDASILDRLQAVLGANDPALTKLTDTLGALFRPVLSLDGSDAAWTQTNVTLEGPCTIEAWVRLDPDQRKIGNADGIAGAPGQLDFNFFAETPRIFAFPPLADVAVAKKPITPGIWTHVAATRDGNGIWKIYLDGEFDATGTKPAPHPIENVRIAWTSAKGGTRGALSEMRLWNRERTADEIRALSDRSVAADVRRQADQTGNSQLGTRKDSPPPHVGGYEGLVFASSSGDWGTLQAGAKVIKTSDYPPILTGDEAATLDAKYAKFRSLAEKPGDPARGKVAALVCQACHLFGTTGGNIGPNLSGVGAMGTEAILRNILQPNAAMEAGYRIFRIELKNGDLIDALFVSEDKAATVVRMPGADDRRIPKSEIRSAKFLRRSLMAEGLLDGMMPEQVSDLFAYLKTLK